MDREIRRRFRSVGFTASHPIVLQIDGEKGWEGD